MPPPVAPGEFKRRPLLYRYLFKTEQLLGSLPMVIVTPVVGAIGAAAVAARAPDHEVVRGGDVIDRSSYLHVFGVAAIGALAGVVLVLVLAFLWNVWTYRSRTDRSFATQWGLTPKPLTDLTESPQRRRQTHVMPTVFLNATDVPPLDPATTLGPIKGIAQLPDRSLMGCRRTAWQPIPRASGSTRYARPPPSLLKVAMRFGGMAGGGTSTTRSGEAFTNTSGPNP